MMEKHTSTVRVRYAETDQMGIVHHANYLVWLEVARVDYCVALGFRYRDMEQSDGIFLAVVEANCRYLRPARFDDDVAITVGFRSSNHRMAEFDYEIRRGKELLATAFTRHIYVSREMSAVRLPERYWPMFGIEKRSAPSALPIQSDAIEPLLVR